MITNPLTLDCRLLAASVCTYYVLQNGPFDETNCKNYYQAANYASTPVGFVGGDEQINACLVGTINDAGGGPAVLLAFRGTLPVTDPPTFQEILDWFNDADDTPMSAPNIPGQVHTGFWTALQTLWPAAIAEVRKQMGAGGGSLPLYITGHSKGGAMASLAAAQCVASEKITPAAVYTYASPMTGDVDFASWYNGLAFPDTRYEYTDDIVPHLPPSPYVADLFAYLPVVGPWFQKMAKYNYTSVGTLKFIDWSGQIEGDSLGLWLKRFASLTELILTLQFSQIAADHGASCGAGYMTYICPSGVCGSTPPPAADAGAESTVRAWREARLRQLG